MSLNLVLLVAGTLGLVAFVCLNSYAGARLLRQGALPYNPLLHPLENAGRLTVAGLCLVLGVASGAPTATLGWVESSLLTNLAIGVGAALVLQELNYRGTRWAVRGWGKGSYSPAFLRALLPRSRRDWAIASVVLLPAALAEELLFRSLAIGGLSLTLNPWVLVVLFAALFGLAHLPQGRLGVVGSGLLGLLLGALFVWRWSLVACTIAHYGVNLAQLLRGEDDLRWLERQP